MCVPQKHWLIYTNLITSVIAIKNIGTAAEQIQCNTFLAATVKSTSMSHKASLRDRNHFSCYLILRKKYLLMRSPFSLHLINL